MPCCGPKLSACGVMLSIWGIIMLGLLGVFFYVRSPALSEDLPVIEDHWKNISHSYTYIEELYEQAAYNCWIACGIYVLIFITSCVNLKLNLSNTYAMQ